MNAKIFLDTNLLSYAIVHNDAQSPQARSLIHGGGTIDVQVMIEVAHVASRKLERIWADIS